MVWPFWNSTGPWTRNTIFQSIILVSIRNYCLLSWFLILMALLLLKFNLTYGSGLGFVTDITANCVIIIICSNRSTALLYLWKGKHKIQVTIQNRMEYIAERLWGVLYWFQICLLLCQYVLICVGVCVGLFGSRKRPSAEEYIKNITYVIAVFGMGRFMFSLGGQMHVLPYWGNVSPCTPPYLHLCYISKVLYNVACVIVSATFATLYVLYSIVDSSYAM